MVMDQNQLHITKGGKMNNLDKLTMYDLAFSTRVFEVFKLNNITIEDILANKYSLSDFAKLPNIGRKSIKEIKEAFLSYGFKFSDNDNYFKDVDHYFEAKKETTVREDNLYIILNLEVIEKCRQALISSFENIVKKESFSYQEFDNAMIEHKKILNMFDQNIRNIF
jgi:hypothetical protein